LTVDGPLARPVAKLAPRREYHHAFRFDSRADHLHYRCDLILGYRQVRARWTARKFAQNPSGPGLPRGNPTAGAAIAWRRILAKIAALTLVRRNSKLRRLINAASSSGDDPLPQEDFGFYSAAFRAFELVRPQGRGESDVVQ
jgi:hypothetical protein